MLTLKVNKQNIILEKMYKICELEGKVGSDDTSIEQEDQDTLKFVKSWQVLDAKFASNIKRFIFNFYYSDFDAVRK